MFYYNTNRNIIHQKKILHNLLSHYRINGYRQFTSYPVCDYYYLKERNFYDLPDEQIMAFVRTSGTQSFAKLIPISKEYLHANHLKASKLILKELLLQYRQYHILKGNNLVLNGYLYNEVYRGKPVIDISALLFLKRPTLFRSIGYPEKQFSHWKEKLNYLLQNIDKLGRITSISGVPTWMLSLFVQMKKKTGKPVNELLPNLKLIIHGGVIFDNYYAEFDKIFHDRKLTYYNVYNATEGFYGIQFKKGNYLKLLNDAGIFYEFKNEEGVVPVWQAQKNKEYELIISNSDGLLRYRTNDIIKILSLEPFVFSITGRVDEYINAFGEDMLITQARAALNKTLARFPVQIITFFVVPFYSTGDEVGYHEWYFVVNEKLPTEIIEKTALYLDQALMEINNNYKQKRNNSLAMQNLKIKQIDFDTYTGLIKKFRNAQGGQTKLKHLYNNREIIKFLNYG